MLFLPHIRVPEEKKLTQKIEVKNLVSGSLEKGDNGREKRV